MTKQPLQLNFPPAARGCHSDSKLYSFAEIPSMDQADEDYVLFLTVRAADPDQERLIADTCTRAINSLPQVLSALQAAYDKLESAAYISEEGDTDEVKRQLSDTILALSQDILRDEFENVFFKYDTIYHHHVDWVNRGLDYPDSGLVLLLCRGSQWVILQESGERYNAFEGVLKSEKDFETIPVFYPDMESVAKAAFAITKQVFPTCDESELDNFLLENAGVA